MQTTTDDLADYDHRLSGVLLDALIRKGIFTSAEVAAMHQQIADTASGPRAAAVRHLATQFVRANGG